MTKVINALFPRVLVFLLAFALVIGIREAKGNTITQNLGISWGSQGEVVKHLQTALGPFYGGEIDGRFGYDTLEALMYYQRKNGLSMTGVADAATQRVLKADLDAYNSQVNERETDIWLLACLIDGETRGASYPVQVAIGAIALNRVSSDAYPDSLWGVIYQPGGFESVSLDGVSNTPSRESLMAARDALSGFDPAYGATEYIYTSTAPTSALDGFCTVRRIGSYVFGYRNGI